MALKLANLALSSLASSITLDATTFSIQAADAGKFPILADGDWHPATIVDSSGNSEIVKVTARAGALLTVIRAQEGTTAKAFTAGSRIDVRLTVAAIESLKTVPPHQHSTDDIIGLVALIEGYIAELVDSSPAALDTLKELAAALGNDPNFATTVLTALAGKVSKTGGDTMKAPLALDGLSGAEKMLRFLTGGLDRWRIGAPLDPESAGNEGSDLCFFRFADDGTYIDGPFRISRKTGITTVNTIRLGNKASAADIAAGVSDKFPDAPAVKAAIAAAGGLGVGQTWQDMLPSRGAGTVYQNTSGKPIIVAPQGWARSGFCEGQVSADNSNWFTPPRPEKVVSSDTLYYFAYPMFVVPPGHYYRLTVANNFLGTQAWLELR